MQAQFRPVHPRIANFHGPKHQLLGYQAGHAAPAWKVGNPAQIGIGPQGKQRGIDPGSKILLSRLPIDVGETEVEELFKKTVGPLKESFIIYNSQGHSKGMALVSFQRVADAEVAKARYDGKIVDGRRPIKIEIVTDSVYAIAQPPTAPTPPSLLSRLGGATNTKNMVNGQATTPPAATPTKPRQRPISHHIPPVQPAPHVVGAPLQRIRRKKGPRRLKKSVAQLDKEMEDYRAAAAGGFEYVRMT